MADQIKKIEMRERGDGTYNQLLYPKTSSDLVITTSGKTVQQEIDDLKSSVSNGKNQVATAITGMGQSASGSDTFSQLAAKISNISSDANATVAEVLTGRTFYQGGVKRTGTMPNRGGARTITPSTTNQVLNSGYYSGNITVAGSSNLTAGNIRNGVNIFGVVGNYTGLGSVANVIRGTYTLAPSTHNIVNISIPSVTVGSSIVTHSAWTKNAVSMSTFLMTSKITSSTNIQFERRQMNSSSETIELSYQVVQFNNVKAKYVGEIMTGKPTVIGSTSSININKCVVFFSHRTSSSGLTEFPYFRALSVSPRLYVSESSVYITFDLGQPNYDNHYCYYQIIEFN